MSQRLWKNQKHNNPCLIRCSDTEPVYQSGFSGETEPVAHRQRQQLKGGEGGKEKERERDCKKLAHVIMKAGKSKSPALTRRLETHSGFLQVEFFPLFSSANQWMRLTHITDRNLLYLKSADYNDNHTFAVTAMLFVHNIAKLTCNINYHSLGLKSLRNEENSPMEAKN